MGDVTYLVLRDTTTEPTSDPERERLLAEVRRITAKFGLPA